MRAILTCLLLPSILAAEIWGIAHFGVTRGFIGEEDASALWTIAGALAVLGLLLLIRHVLQAVLAEMYAGRSS